MLKLMVNGWNNRIDNTRGNNDTLIVIFGMAK